MKISSVKNISFSGVASPYVNKYGYSIIPITKNPKQEEIDSAVNAAKNSAGVFDFEYMGYENLNNIIHNYEKGWHQGSNPHLSDTTPFPSNLRSFEHRTLYQYLMNGNDSKYIFDCYLDAKSEYHKKLSENYLDCSKIALASYNHNLADGMINLPVENMPTVFF